MVHDWLIYIDVVKKWSMFKQSCKTILTDPANGLEIV